MTRCFCPCHMYPGTYPPPCSVCGHDTREGQMVGTVHDGWEPFDQRLTTHEANAEYWRSDQAMEND